MFCFNKVIEKEVERYIEQVEEIRKENELEMKNKNEEIDVLNYRLNKERDMKLEIQTKYADLWNENENTNHQLTITNKELTITKNNVVKLQEKLEELLFLSIENLTWNDYVYIGEAYIKYTEADLLYLRE